MIAVGVDACPGGWVAVVVAEDAVGTVHRATLKAIGAVHGATLEAMGAQLPHADGFGVDIPIGMPTDGPRSADVAARRFLGPRRSSVFPAPVRDALAAATYAEANATSRRVTGHGLSRQAYALAPKILEAEQWCERHPTPVREVHPEVSFAVLLGHPAAASKKTWSGVRERLVALEGAGIVLGDLPGAGSRAGVDDVLDAAAAAWTTARLLRGRARSFPDPPDIDPATGRPVAIWA